MVPYGNGCYVSQTTIHILCRKLKFLQFIPLLENAATERRKALLNSEAKGFAPVTKNPWGKIPCFLGDTLLSNEGTASIIFLM